MLRHIIAACLFIMPLVGHSQALDIKKLIEKGEPPAPPPIKLHRRVEGQSISYYFQRPVKFQQASLEFADADAVMRGDNFWGSKLVLGKGVYKLSSVFPVGSQFPFCVGDGTVIEGQGPETIIINEKAFSEKNPNADFTIWSQGGCTIKNLTMVNARFGNESKDPDQYWNVHFAGKFTEAKDWHPGGPVISLACYGCIFDQINLGGFEASHTAHIGSVVWSAEKKAYVPYQAKDFGPYLNTLKADFEKKHASGKPVPPDKAIARAAFFSLRGPARTAERKLVNDTISPAIGRSPDSWDASTIRDGLSMLIAEQFGLEKNYDFTKITGEQLKQKVSAEVNAGRPLSALVYIGRAARGPQLGGALEEAIKIVKPKMQALAARVKPCAVNVEYSPEFLASKNVSKSEDFKEERDSGATLHQLLNFSMKHTLPQKYPFLNLGKPEYCTMQVTLTEDKYNSWVEEQDRKIGYHKEIDWQAAHQAEVARGQARMAAVANLSASFQSSFASMENTWRTFQNRSVHFQQHVGGKDLVTYNVKMNNNHQLNQNALDAQRDAINASIGSMGSFERLAQHEVVTWHRVADAEVAGRLAFLKAGKPLETYELKPIKGKWTVSQCETKYYKDGTEMKESLSQDWNACKKSLESKNWSKYGFDYADTSIFPYVDLYLDKHFLKSTTGEMKAAKTGQGAVKNEAILFYRWLGIPLNETQRFAMLDHFDSIDAEGEFVEGALALSR